MIGVVHRVSGRLPAAMVMAAVGAYYFWGVQAAGYGFQWRSDLGGYYNLLARGFAGGHLYVPVEPSRELLAMPNPWDPSIDDRYRMQDMALYNGRYYLYFGAAPAVTLFLPWRFATGHDLPENFALFLFCFGGYLFACAAFLRLLQMAGAAPGSLLTAVMLLGLGLCQSIPFLLNRVWVYEVAIGSGYFFSAAGVYSLTLGLKAATGKRWIAAAGVLFGLATASRPDLVLAGAVAAVVLGLSKGGSKYRILHFLCGFAAVLAVVALYNYQRFGNPFEFGFRYQLAGPGQNRVDVSPSHLLPGAYYFLLAPPEFSPVFPWVRTAFRHPFHLPPDYFLEPITGAFWLAPFLASILFFRDKTRSKEARTIIWIAFGGAGAIAVFLMSSHLVTQRYEADFLPLALLAAFAGFAIRAHSLFARVVLTVLALFGAGLNLALAVAGPYEEMLANRPEQYVRLARFLSPIARFRPMLDPAIQLDLDLRRQNDMPRQTLVALGRGPHSYTLLAEGTRLISQTDRSTVTLDLPPDAVHLRLSYSGGFMLIENDGRILLRQPTQALVMAPSQVIVTAPAVLSAELEAESPR